MAKEMSEFEKEMLAEQKAHNARMLEAMGARATPSTSPDDQFAAEMAERRGTNKPAIPAEMVPSKSPDTASTFVAKIVRGVVVDLVDYTFPDGIDRHVDDSPAGLVPHGKEIYDTNGKEIPDYKQWKWTEYYQRDLKSFVGRPLPRYARADQAA